MASTEQTRVDQPVPASLIVHLVHGTWPEGGWLAHRFAWLTGRVIVANWLLEGSSFRRELLAAFPTSHQVSFDCDFNWRGRNSVTERAVGTLALKEHLARAIGADAESEHLVIAHSHGGNVALNALRALPPTVSTRVVGLVCLATPFLHTEPSAMASTLTFNAGIERVFFAFAMLAALYLALIVSWLFKRFGPLSSPEMYSWPSPAIYISVTVSLLSAGAIMRWIRGTRAKLPAENQGISEDNLHILSIHSPGDEVYRGISAAETLAAFFAAPVELILLVARWTLGLAVVERLQAIWKLKLRWIILFALAYAAAMVFLVSGYDEFRPSFLSTCLAGFELLLRRVAALWFLMNLAYVPTQVLLSAAYGVEAVAVDGALRPRFEAAPVGRQSTVYIFPATPEWTGVRHSVALRPGVAAVIAHWFERIVEIRRSSRPA